MSELREKRKQCVKVALLVLLTASLVASVSCAYNTSESETAVISEIPAFNKIPDIAVPSKAEIAELGTLDYDMNAVQAKGLAADEKTLSEEYIYLQAVYRAGLNRWLDCFGLLSELDFRMKTDARNFILQPVEEYSYDQKYASYGRAYLFLRNCIFIERLSDSDLQTLREVTSVDDAALEELVVRTYRELIVVREDDGSPSGSVIYKTTIFGLWKAPPDALVFEIRYRWDYNSAYDEAIADLEGAKEKDVNRWRDAFVKSLYEQTGTSVFAFIYCF